MPNGIASDVSIAKGYERELHGDVHASMPEASGQIASSVAPWHGANETATARFMERSLDIAVASTLLVAATPVMLVLALAIRLDSPGPALFWQTRMGANRRSGRDRRRSNRAGGSDRRNLDFAGRPFRFVKFRTMYSDARIRFPELYEYAYSDEEIRTMKFKLDDDPRLTRVGSWLRKTSLDELPNLWNVLTGDVGLVGPRPEIPEMSPYYTPEQRRKFTVKPGVTGLAQISGRGRLTFQETVAHDLDYVARRSPTMNVRILVQTLKSVLWRDGAF